MRNETSTEGSAARNTAHRFDSESEKPPNKYRIPRGHKSTALSTQASFLSIEP